MSLRTSFIRSSLCALKVQRVKAGCNLELVRFRKPRFEPRAASKLYRVREPTPILDEELQMMKKWTQKYSTDMKSLRAYLREYYRKLDEHKASEIKPVSIEAEMNVMVKKNQAFNKESKKLRIELLQEKRTTEKVYRQKLVERSIREIEEMKSKAEAQVALEKSMYKESIRPENLDKKLERLLNTKHDHNYPITKSGRIVQKEDTDSSPVKSEESQK